MHTIDIFVQNYFFSIRTVYLTEFMYLLTILFDFSIPFILIILSLTLLVYMVRNFRYAVLFISSLAISGIAIYFLKFIFDISRPLGGVMGVFGQSFPSWHATIATVFFIMLMYIFDDYFKGFWRTVFNVFCIIMVITVAFSRLYLGVHWLSDVLGGIILGVLISYFSVRIFRNSSLNKK